MSTGDLHIPYIPEPDFVAVEKIFNVRKVLKGRPLPLPSNVIDGGRREEMDNFYLLAQLHRDQFKDRSGKIHPLVYFRYGDYPWQCPQEPTRNYLKFPQYYIRYRKPPMLPVTVGRMGPLPRLPERTLRNHYEHWIDTRYKY